MVIINQELFGRVFDSLVNRLRQDVANEGGHLQDVIREKYEIRNKLLVL